MADGRTFQGIAKVPASDATKSPSAPIDGLATSEAMLVERVRHSDPAALEAIFDAYATRLLAFAYAQVRSRETAEEIVQDLFLSIWSGRARWSVRGGLKIYLFQAVRNRVLNDIRAQRVRDRNIVVRDPALITGYASRDRTDDRTCNEDLEHAIERAIAELPERNRQVFLLVRQQNLAHREVASILGISVKAVEMHMIRALHALRLRLSDWR